MKRLLDKTWAKLTSFFLTLLFGTMTVLGGLGVGIRSAADSISGWRRVHAGNDV